MKKEIKRLKLATSFALTLSIVAGTLASCGGGNKAEGNSEGEVADNEAFYATQPLESGLYDASYYVITSDNAEGKEKSENKGHFDGRVFFSLSPEQSAMYVFENGNRTKINYIVNLEKPFEKTDSGTYVTTDTKQKPVLIMPDSANYILNFDRGAESFKITMNQKPRFTGSAVEIMEKMVEQKNKK